MRGKGFGVTPSSLYKKPKTKNPTNKEVMETLAELRAQVLQLQNENARYREERCVIARLGESRMGYKLQVHSSIA